MEVPQSASLPPDIFAAACPARQAINRIAGKWPVLILMVLAQGPHNFGELQRRIECISHKVLTQSLRNLEREGFVIRTTIPGRVEKVRYELSAVGISLLTPLEALWQWAAAYGGSNNKILTRQQ